jgi:LmbE family N-acetylglucosaminyl deacetylase
MPIRQRLEQGFFAALRRLWVARSRDITDRVLHRRTLVIAPHADDETLGVGGTMARLTAAGAVVHAAVVCDGRYSQSSKVYTAAQIAAMREVEMVEACAVLGVPAQRVHQLRFEDRHADRNPARLREEIARLIESTRPEQVFSPFGVDGHPDHRAVAAAVRSLGEGGAIRCPVYEYPIWLYNLRLWSQSGSVTPRSLYRTRRMIRDLAPLRTASAWVAPYLPAKRAALRAHRTQVENFTGEPEWTSLDPVFLSHLFDPRELFFIPKWSRQTADG